MRLVVKMVESTGLEVVRQRSARRTASAACRRACRPTGSMRCSRRRSRVAAGFARRPDLPVRLFEALCGLEGPLRLLYSSSMTGRIGAKGQVVIPKALRDRAHLQPGDEIDFELREEEIVLIARRSPARLGGRFSKTGMAMRLLEDRAREPR